MKVCDRCGSTCGDEMNYCELCGAQLPAAPPPPPGYPQNSPPYGQPGQYQQYQQYQPYQNYQGYPQYPQPPYPMQQPSAKRKAPLTLGIIGVVFALILPVVTYACSIPGLVMACKDIQMGADNRNARTLNIVALIIAFANSLLGVMLNLSDFI